MAWMYCLSPIFFNVADTLVHRCHGMVVGAEKKSENNGMTKSGIFGTILLSACGLLILYAEELHWIALWNLFPLFVAGLVMAHGTRGTTCHGRPSLLPLSQHWS